jgi:hypothetical protein
MSKKPDVPASILPSFRCASNPHRGHKPHPPVGRGLSSTCKLFLLAPALLCVSTGLVRVLLEFRSTANIRIKGAELARHVFRSRHRRTLHTDHEGMRACANTYPHMSSRIVPTQALTLSQGKSGELMVRWFGEAASEWFDAAKGSLA